MKTKEELKEYFKSYKEKHKKEINQKNKIYRIKHREEIKERNRIYRITHRQHIKDYKKRNRKRINKLMKIYLHNRFNSDVSFKLAHYLRTRITRALRGNPKFETTMNLVGCSLEFLIVYLASKFTSGMSWDNYGKWHIDHIKPCINFDMSKESEQHKCFHYTNLQPLWAEDNLKKNKF
jgi:hypothetical protein